MNVVIIEDEINAYHYLKKVLMEIVPNAIVVKHLDSVEESINWFTSNDTPDLIFMDIELSDGQCFEIFNHAPVEAPIIFTTAYDDYAIRAFKLNSIDYLLKPIPKNELSQAIKKFEKSYSHSKTQRSSDLEKLLTLVNTNKRNRFLIKKGGYFTFIDVSQIAFIQSEDTITFLYEKNGKKHIYTKPVENIIQELDDKNFFQVNRKQIIHIKAVEEIHPYFNQRLKLQLNHETTTEFIVSRKRVTDFKKWVDQ